MLTIPTQATPAQTLRAVLADQACTISLYQKPQGMFADVAVDGTIVSAGVICRNNVPFVIGQFVGNLVIVTTNGATEPDYTGFQLIYLTAEEYALFQQ